MRLSARAVLPLAVALAVGCQPATFLVQKKGQTTVSGSPVASLLGSFPTIGSFTNLDFDQDETFQNQGVSKAQIRSVTLDKVQLQVTSPDTQDFTFLQELELRARASDADQRVAHKEAIDQLDLPAPNPVLKLDLDPVELLPFVQAPTMSLIVRGNGHAPAQDTTLEATVVLRVQVKLF